MGLEGGISCNRVGRRDRRTATTGYLHRIGAWGGAAGSVGGHRQVKAAAACIFFFLFLCVINTDLFQGKHKKKKKKLLLLKRGWKGSRECLGNIVDRRETTSVSADLRIYQTDFNVVGFFSVLRGVVLTAASQVRSPAGLYCGMIRFPTVSCELLGFG